MLDVGELIGANVSFDVGKHMRHLRPFIKRYDNLYRMWSDHPSGTSLETIEADASSRGYMSATTSTSAIKQMMSNNDFDVDDVSITKFSAEGFDPYDVISVGIKQHPHHEEIEFLRRVLDENVYQSEIVVTRVLGPQKLIRVN
jgi:hypothetical protein